VVGAGDLGSAGGWARGDHVPVGDDAAGGYRVRARHAGTGAGTVQAGRNAASHRAHHAGRNLTVRGTGTTDRSAASHHARRAHRDPASHGAGRWRRVHGELP